MLFAGHVVASRRTTKVLENQNEYGEHAHRLLSTISIVRTDTYKNGSDFTALNFVMDAILSIETKLKSIRPDFVGERYHAVYQASYCTQDQSELAVLPS